MSADDDPSLTEFVSGMYGDLSFEWDAAKSARNTRERGLPFDIAPTLFERFNLTSKDTRRDYGEDRFRLIGCVNDAVLYCVYTLRPDGVCRIISLRYANRKERHGYRTATSL